MRNKGIYYLLFCIGLVIIVAISVLFLGNNQNNSQPQTGKTIKPVPSASAGVEKEEAESAPFVAETDDYKAIEKIQEENPWIGSVPIVESNYITRYIYENGSIEIVVYTFNGTVQYSKQELDNIQSSVTEILKERGVPVESVKITLRVE